MNKMSTHTARNKKPRIPLSGHGAVLLLLFAIMIESKRRLLEVFGNLADASGQLLVLQAAGVAPPGEVLVELGVVDAGPLGNLLGVEAVEVVEERAEVVLELEVVVGQLFALFRKHFAHFIVSHAEIGNGLLGRVAISGNAEVLFLVFRIASERAVCGHFDNNGHKFLFVYHIHTILTDDVANRKTLLQKAPDINQTSNLPEAAEPPGASLSEQLPSQSALNPLTEFLGTVPWHGIHLSGDGAEPKVVFASVANQAATCRREFLYELTCLHNIKELFNNTAKVYNNITSIKHNAMFLYGSKDI